MDERDSEQFVETQHHPYVFAKASLSNLFSHEGSFRNLLFNFLIVKWFGSALKKLSLLHIVKKRGEWVVRRVRDNGAVMLLLRAWA